MPFAGEKLFTGLRKSQCSTLSSVQMEKMLDRIGWECVRQDGSHLTYKHQLVSLAVSVAPGRRGGFTPNLVARKSKDCGFNELDLEGKLPSEVLTALFIERCIKEAAIKGNWDSEKVGSAKQALATISQQLKKRNLLGLYYKYTEHKLIPQNCAPTAPTPAHPEPPEPDTAPSAPSLEPAVKPSPNACNFCQTGKISESILFENVCVECSRTICTECASQMFPKEPSSPTCLACYKPLPLPVEPAVPIARCCSCDQVLSPERVQNNHKTCDRSCAGKYANSIKKMQAVALEATAAEIQSPETRPTEPAIQPTQPTSEPDENKMNKSVKTIYYAVYVKDGTSEQVHRAFRREDTAQLCLYGLRKEGKGAVIRKMEQLEISEETASEFLANELKAMS